MKKEELFNEVLKSWEVPVNQSKDQAWESLQARIRETKVIPLYKRPAVWSAAAAAFIAAVGVFMFSNNDVNITAATNQEHTLPDGSVVFLDKGAQLAYDGDWESRTLTLEGEAFFQVEEGEKFTVQTALGDVAVLGTSFNVYADNQNFQVECYTGKVKVSGETSAEIITKGQGVKLRGSELSEPFAHSLQTPMNETGVFHYAQADLIRVIEDVEAAFAVNVSVEGSISGEEFSGQFDAEDATTALSLIAKAMGMNVTTAGTGEYVLVKN
ncbi:MAG: FecR domain-containing protein [Flavobacteriales bacterium]|nr:FecR domain-containing protein [Flavobacteriales bacterium]